MKVPISWLKEFVSFSLPAEKLAEKLTLAGFEVEGISESEGDQVLDVAVMPNRGDCLSIRGIAREVAALLGRKGIPVSLKQRRETSLVRTKGVLDLDLRAKKGCLRYMVRVIRNLKVAPSPEWMRRRLVQSGLRSINNVVDVTNYVLLELGQPLHAFDLQKIGSKIIIRYATPDEEFEALDGKKYKLESSDLLIADPKGPIALAGIMGGAYSEVSSSTSDVALESAFFHPATIRKTARRLGIQTESSYRFERRVDPEAVSLALDRATDLFRQIASGESSADCVDRKVEKFRPKKISFRPESVSRLLGDQRSPSLIRSRIRRLGFIPKGKNQWLVPSYRGDVQEEIDLIEEVVRLEGYDKVPLTLSPLNEPPVFSFHRDLTERARLWMADQGFFECVHLSFVSPRDLEYDPPLLGLAVPLANPLGYEDSLLRPSLIPSLLKTAAYHEQHKLSGFRGFELRTIYRRKEGGKEERRSLAAVISSERTPAWYEQRRSDFFDIKGFLESLGNHLGVRLEFQRDEFSSLLPGGSASVSRNGEKIGFLGEVHPKVLEHFNLKSPLFLFEVLWDRLVEGLMSEVHFQSFSKVPQVQRDLALLVDGTIPSGQIKQFLESQSENLVKKVLLFDLYEGEQIPKGKKSLAFSLFLGQDKTLIEEEIQKAWQRIIESLRREFHADIR
ncbi:MAG: phenylalanine--tRNA ligase subunit beta [Deltaproteobacteria bacterium]|nr:phenylalanine--tRNA ligase subunit beta [Deltaproteobacteria bacterium]